MDWIQGGFPQRAMSGPLQPGGDWSFALPQEEIRDLQLRVEHETGLAWQPRMVTGAVLWEHPSRQIGERGAQVEIFGTMLVHHGVRWAHS